MTEKINHHWSLTECPDARALREGSLPQIGDTAVGLGIARFGSLTNVVLKGLCGQRGGPMK